MTMKFKLLRIIGRGAFGKVRIVEHRESRRLYAMKYIDKEECIRLDAARNIIRERNILEQLDHPFLCRLRFAFQDEKAMYMISDLMLGGDLQYHLNPETPYSDDILRFWFAELSSAVQYLHTKRVIHRDIKPANILLDDRGHVHLTDFNVATLILRNRQVTSNSGTSFYMAPEIFKGGGYNEAVDWWSLGVTLYECVYKKRPFEHESFDELTAAVRRGHIQYPNRSRPISGELLSVMQGFLELTPSRRLGQGEQGWVQLLQHPFFRPIDWIQLEAKMLPPPYMPPQDRNNFDPTLDLEQMVLEDYIPQRRKTKQDDPNHSERSKYERDMELIATKFKPFDFTIFEKYEGFKDPVKRTVGAPPDWVKPAFDGADRDHLPIKRISTGQAPAPGASMASSSTSTLHYHPRHLHDPLLPGHELSPPPRGSTPSLWRSASVQNIAAKANLSGVNLASSSAIHDPQKRRSLGTCQPSHSATNISSAASLSEEYAMSLQGIRKKQSTRSFRERRERDRKNLYQ
ncbi:kinase-like protein [Hesseltinella vesiculosa]|uniref:Kinase-like protein n=1 Tax=Hesseltinella vesiculosa TaxID=101127 RepID=A0A1X2GM20_9FUNG|nr:kinase-like protein [Hesseltinella vesiculosa]